MEPDQITSVKRMDYGEYCFRTTNIDKPPRSLAEGVTDTLVLSFFGSRAVLAWMSILSKANEALGDGEALVGVKDIVLNHWAKYGRHFYCRYDYEGVDSEAANQVMVHSLPSRRSITSPFSLLYSFLPPPHPV